MKIYWKNKITKFINYFDHFTRIISYVAGSLLILMMLFIVREVFGRYFFNSPTYWSLELCIMLFVALIYLGSAYTTNIGKHPRADFLYCKYKGKVKVILDTVIYTVCIIYTLVMVQQGIIMALEALRYSETASGVFRIPLFPVKILVPLGSFLVIVSFIIKIIKIYL